MSSPLKPTDPLSVTVRIMGKEYTVVCPQEEHEALVRSADYLNDRMTSIRRRGKALGTEKIAVMAALNIARELLESHGDGSTPGVGPEAAQRLRQMSLEIDSALQPETRN